ncbi:MAG: hypothetical protein J0L69_04675 [Bacteroidetes bacterium]|nr:hypothetical protein [Bacteroidota bacterium]
MKINKTYILFIVLFIHFGLKCQTECIALVKNKINHDSSIVLLEKCAENTKQDTISYVKTICHLSNLLTKKSRYVRAEKKLFSLLSLIYTPRHKLLRGVVYNHLANNYKASRELSKALRFYLQAEILFEKEKSYNNLIKLYTDMAEYYRSQGQYGDARKYIKKSHDLFFKKASRDTLQLIHIYNRYAAIANENSPSDSSLMFSLLALDLCRKTGNLHGEAISYNEIGFAMKNRKNVDSSMNCYKRAFDLWMKVGADADAIHAKYNLALLLGHNNYPKKIVLPIYQEIIEMVINKKIDYPLDQVFLGLSNCYFFAGDSLDYYRARKYAYEALMEKNRKIYDLDVSNIKERYENEKNLERITKYTNELEESEKKLTLKRKENRVMYISLIVLIPLLIIIGFLLKRIYTDNKRLNTKNKEKDVLIQEIHHRVKNNLQFVSSLINMQINSSKSNLEIDSLNDASRRIRSMALVHEMLYNQDNLEGVEIKKYLEELMSSINEIVNSKNIPIQFNIQCEKTIFETTKAIALGMITSELVSNSIKYAFKKTPTPCIDIELKKLNTGKISFTVRDNGLGMNNKVDTNSEKLGMRLISIFSRQIKGDYSFQNDGGLVYTITFEL